MAWFHLVFLALLVLANAMATARYSYICGCWIALWWANRGRDKRWLPRVASPLKGTNVAFLLFSTMVHMSTAYVFALVLTGLVAEGAV